MNSDSIIYIILIVMIAAVFGFMMLGLSRKRNGYKLTIIKDFRNMSTPPKKYLALYNPQKDEHIKLYSNILSPIKSKIIPPFNLQSFAYTKNIYAYQGVSGHNYDDNIVPIHLPVIGLAAAQEYSQEMSNIILSVVDHYNIYEKMSLQEGMGVELDNKSYKISQITARGVYLTGEGLKEPLEIFDIDKISKLKILTKPKESKKIYMNDLVTAEFIAYNLGVVPTEDVNIMLSNAKDAISSFNSKIATKQNSVMSLFGKYPWLIPMVILMLAAGISSAVMYTGSAQAASSIYNTAGAAITSINNTAISAIDSITKTLGKP